MNGHWKAYDKLIQDQVNIFNMYDMITKTSKTHTRMLACIRIIIQTHIPPFIYIRLFFQFVGNSDVSSIPHGESVEILFNLVSQELYFSINEIIPKY